MQVELRSSEMDTIEGVSINLPPEKRSAILILIICITPIIHREAKVQGSRGLMSKTKDVCKRKILLLMICKHKI